MARRVHDADGEVIAACAARGDSTVTARKLERWRQAGCVPARLVEHRAGLAVSVSANPDGYVDQVLAISAALRGGLALRRVPIALFADGYPVEFDALRSAYLDLVGSLRTMAAKVAGAHDDPLDAADAVAVAFAARLGESMLAPMLARARQTARQAGAGSRQGAHDLLTGRLVLRSAGCWSARLPRSRAPANCLPWRAWPMARTWRPRRGIWPIRTLRISRRRCGAPTRIGGLRLGAWPRRSLSTCGGARVRSACCCPPSSGCPVWTSSCPRTRSPAAA